MVTAARDEILLNLTRAILDLKAEKKSINKDFNKRIKKMEADIAACVKE